MDRILDNIIDRIPYFIFWKNPEARMIELFLLGTYYWIGQTSVHSMFLSADTWWW